MLPGSGHFHVEELPAYGPSGSGEHLYVHLEKEGLTTDQVAEALGAVCHRPFRDVGYAGRKDRHGVTRQWFSVHLPGSTGPGEAALAAIGERLPQGRVQILTVSRHANKIRLGHLAGNRFRLGLGDVDPGLGERLQDLARQGLRHRFGPQRFGINGSNLRAAAAWGRGDAEAAVAALLDPTDTWRWGDPLPEGYRPGLEGRLLGALRRGVDAAAGLRMAGDPLRMLIASAGQSAIFNAILDARVAAGLLHTLRPGDVAIKANGPCFTVAAEDLAEANRRAAPGCLEVAASAPLPGSNRLVPAPDILAEEKAWSAPTGMDWSWFAKGGALESPGERRALVQPLLEPPTLAEAEGVTWLSFALPAGAYATEVLTQAGVSIPEDRRG